MTNPVPLLRKVNLAEAVSYVVLAFIAMPLKYAFDMPMAVKVVGWIHGVLFALFAWALVRVVFDGGWSPKRIVGVFLASLVPIVPFFVDRYFPAWIAEWRPPQES